MGYNLISECTHDMNYGIGILDQIEYLAVLGDISFSQSNIINIFHRGVSGLLRLVYFGKLF